MKKQLFILFLAVNFVFAYGQQKIKIEKAEDLPKHNYQLANTNLSELINDDVLISDLAAKVKKDLENDLDTYEFSDPSILKEYYGDLSIIAMLEGDYNAALKYIYNSRELSDKESEKLVRACEFEAYLSTMKEASDNDETEQKQIMKEKLATYLETLPFEIIQEDIEGRKGRAEIYSENMIKGYLEGELQQSVDNTKGNVPLDVAMTILGMKSTITYYLPNKDIWFEVHADLLDRKAVTIEKKDIWKERSVTLKDSEKYTPVVVGIWDTGVDIEIFPENNQWTNTKEKKNGKDTDKNGYIDDIHGVAYDYEGRKSTSMLIHEADTLANLEELQGLFAGLIDMLANVDSEQAKKFKSKTSEMTPEQYEKFFELINLLGSYNHGTHVAGIAVEGNPFARILSARLMFDYKNIPDIPTMETAERWAKMYEDVLTYFTDNNVRVVNMSWSMDIRVDILPALRKNGVGKDEEERFEIAKKMFDIHQKAFYNAMESTPDILFITAAGNNNDDVDFAGSIPSSFNFPNIMTVGAVDIEGKKTSFTTEGASVDVYANGYEVESYIPGGGRMKMSGTSMASPNVVNLAAKIMAVNPELTPAEVKEIIINNATQSEEDPNVLLIHPKKSIEAVMSNM
jgi:subtilisin family serine protease